MLKIALYFFCGVIIKVKCVYSNYHLILFLNLICNHNHTYAVINDRYKIIIIITIYKEYLQTHTYTHSKVRNGI